jgi:limonene-1,2-epoxide hydrolase
MTDTTTNVNIDIALQAFVYLAERHQKGNFQPYLDMLTDDYTFYAPADGFRGKNVGKGRAAAFYHTITAAKPNFTFSKPLRITSNGFTVVIEFTDEGTLMGQPYFNRIASSFDIKEGKICGYREYFGDIDTESLQKMQS